MAPAMDATLVALLEDILRDPPAGPIRKAFEAAFIETTGDLCIVPDYILDTLTYDLNGTDTAIPPMKIFRVKNLRDFLANRNNENLPLDSSSFIPQDITDFMTAGGNIAPPVPPFVVNAIQAQADLDKNNLQNWERGKRIVSEHEALNDDDVFVTWEETFLNVTDMQGYKRLFESSFDPKQLRPGDDQRLYDKQKAYAIVVLDKVLKTEQGQRFRRTHKGNPRAIFSKYKDHNLNSKNAGTIVSESMADLLNSPISAHKGSQTAYLNLVAQHFEKQFRLVIESMINPRLGTSNSSPFQKKTYMMSWNIKKV